MTTEVKILKIYVGDTIEGNPLFNYQARIKDRLNIEDWSNWIEPDSRSIFYFYNTIFTESPLYIIQLKDNTTQQIFTINNITPITNTKDVGCNSIQFRCAQFKQEQFK